MPSQFEMIARNWGSCLGTLIMYPHQKSIWFLVSISWAPLLPVTTGCIPEHAYQKFYTFDEVTFSLKKANILQTSWIERWAIVYCSVNFLKQGDHYSFLLNRFRKMMWKIIKVEHIFVQMCIIQEYSNKKETWCIVTSQTNIKFFH